MTSLTAKFERVLMVEQLYYDLDLSTNNSENSHDAITNSKKTAERSVNKAQVSFVDWRYRYFFPECSKVALDDRQNSGTVNLYHIHRVRKLPYNCQKTQLAVRRVGTAQQLSTPCMHSNYCGYACIEYYCEYRICAYT